MTKDEGATVFSEAHLTREQFEMLAVNWLGTNEPDQEGPVRFDAIDIIVVGDSKALVRHHIERLSRFYSS